MTDTHEFTIFFDGLRYEKSCCYFARLIFVCGGVGEDARQEKGHGRGRGPACRKRSAPGDIFATGKVLSFARDADRSRGRQ